MDAEDLVAEWEELFSKPVTGWDFAELAGVAQDDTSWSYVDVVREVLSGARSVLDIGTGGGEFLKSLVDALPADTVATEGWPPNVSVAAAALTPQGIPVLSYRAGREREMPFDAERFDVVLARHEEYNAAEVARVLRPGGVLVTQQVEAENLSDLRALLAFASPYPHQTLSAHVRAAVDAGFGIDAAENWEGATTFPEVASLVRYLAMVPWEAPHDFSPARYADVLLALADQHRSLIFTVRRFLLIARRPGAAAATGSAST